MLLLGALAAGGPRVVLADEAAEAAPIDETAEATEPAVAAPTDEMSLATEATATPQAPRAATTASPAPAPILERLDWTWLAGGVTAFTGTAAVLTALDARALEGTLQDRLDASRTVPDTGATVLALARRADRQATLANVLWALTGAAAVTTAVLYRVESAPPVVVAPAGLGVTISGRFP